MRRNCSEPGPRSPAVIPASCGPGRRVLGGVTLHACFPSEMSRDSAKEAKPGFVLRSLRFFAGHVHRQFVPSCSGSPLARKGAPPVSTLFRLGFVKQHLTV